MASDKDSRELVSPIQVSVDVIMGVHQSYIDSLAPIPRGVDTIGSIEIMVLMEAAEYYQVDWTEGLEPRPQKGWNQYRVYTVWTRESDDEEPVQDDVNVAVVWDEHFLAEGYGKVSGEWVPRMTVMQARRIRATCMRLATQRIEDALQGIPR